jgi:hypothetical protein
MSKKKGSHKWNNIEQTDHQHKQQKQQSSVTGVQCNGKDKRDKDVIRFGLNELVHIRHALDAYISTYNKTESHYHPNLLVLDEYHHHQQEVCNSMLEVQEKVKRALEDKAWYS